MGDTRAEVGVGGETKTFAEAMSGAQRPTGLILGTVVAVVAILSISLVYPLVALVLPVEVLAEGGIVVTSVCFLSIWVVLWLWLRLKERRPFATIGFTAGSRAPFLLARGAAVGLAAMALVVAVGLVTGNLVFFAFDDGTIFDPAAIGWVALGLAAFAVQGGAEELVSRGFLVQVWYRRTGIVGAVIASTVFFTVIHGANSGFGVLPALSLVFVALLLVFWALAEGGLFGVLAFHAVWNWAQGSFFGIAVSGNPSPNSLFVVGESDGANPLVTGGAFGIEGSVTTVVLLAILAGLAALWYMRTRRGHAHA